MELENINVAELRGAIITEARGWIGTRFHHQGRIKKTETHKGGCDCIGLIIGVAENVGISVEAGASVVYDIGRTDYGKLPDGILLQQALESYLQPVAVQEILAGDILLFRFEENPQHVGFVSDYAVDGEMQRGIIHCYAQVRKVVEHHLSAEWRRRIVAAYRFKPLQIERAVL